MEAIKIVQEINVDFWPNILQKWLNLEGQIVSTLALKGLIPFLGEIVERLVSDMDIVVEHGKFLVSTSVDASTFS